MSRGARLAEEIMIAGVSIRSQRIAFAMRESSLFLRLADGFLLMNPIGCYTPPHTQNLSHCNTNQCQPRMSGCCLIFELTPAVQGLGPAAGFLRGEGAGKIGVRHLCACKSMRICGASMDGDHITRNPL